MSLLLWVGCGNETTPEVVAAPAEVVYETPALAQEPEPESSLYVGTLYEQEPESESYAQELYEEEFYEEEVYNENPEADVPVFRETPLSRSLTLSTMRDFEALHEVSEEKQRYLAVGAFVPTSNRDSSRIFPVSASSSQARRMLRDSWSVVDNESAMRQLRSLSTASGQSPVADDIYFTLVRNGYLDFIDEWDMLIHGFDFTGLENVYNASVTRASRMDSELELLTTLLGAQEDEHEEVFEFLVMMQFADRVNSGLEAYFGAKEMLISSFGFTAEELLTLPTLAAWDYGRVSIIARYGVAAGFLEEDVAWEYLKIAADRAAEIYSCWREFTAAYILGRALAFGNPSHGIHDTINFLLNHPQSPFQTVAFS